MLKVVENKEIDYNTIQSLGCINKSVEKGVDVALTTKQWDRFRILFEL